MLDGLGPSTGQHSRLAKALFKTTAIHVGSIQSDKICSGTTTTTKLRAWFYCQTTLNYVFFEYIVQWKGNQDKGFFVMVSLLALLRGFLNGGLVCYSMVLVVVVTNSMQICTVLSAAFFRKKTSGHWNIPCISSTRFFIISNRTCFWHSHFWSIFFKACFRNHTSRICNLQVFFRFYISTFIYCPILFRKDNRDQTQNLQNPICGR